MYVTCFGLWNLRAQVLYTSSLVSAWQSLVTVLPGLETGSADLFVNHLAELSEPKFKLVLFILIRKIKSFQKVMSTIIRQAT